MQIIEQQYTNGTNPVHQMGTLLSTGNPNAHNLTAVEDLTVDIANTKGCDY